MDNLSPSIQVNDAHEMSPNLRIIPPVLEMSVVIASTVIRALLAIPHSRVLQPIAVFQGWNPGMRGSGMERKDMEGKEWDTQNMHRAWELQHKQTSAEDNVVPDGDDHYLKPVSSRLSELLTPQWEGFFKDLLCSTYIYFRRNRARGPKGGLLNVKINKKLQPARNSLDKIRLLTFSSIHLLLTGPYCQGHGGAGTYPQQAAVFSKLVFQGLMWCFIS